jgi:hypothetical protein
LREKAERKGLILLFELGFINGLWQKALQQSVLALYYGSGASSTTSSALATLPLNVRKTGYWLIPAQTPFRYNQCAGVGGEGSKMDGKLWKVLPTCKKKTLFCRSNLCISFLLSQSQKNRALNMKPPSLEKRNPHQSEDGTGYWAVGPIGGPAVTLVSAIRFVPGPQPRWSAKEGKSLAKEPQKRRKDEILDWGRHTVTDEVLLSEKPNLDGSKLPPNCSVPFSLPLCCSVQGGMHW